MQEIESTLKQIIADHIGVDISKVVDEAKILDDLGADSLDIVELILKIEEKFDIEISDQEAQSLSTVKDIVDHVKAKKGS